MDDLTINELDVVRTAYLALVRDLLLGQFSPDTELIPASLTSWQGRLISRLLTTRGLTAARIVGQDPDDVEAGRTWPLHATTMIGRKRLENVQHCIEDAVQSCVPGDLIETGVWRGGATIYMCAVLRTLGVSDRRVWVADSFAGLPPGDIEHYPADKDAPPLHLNPQLAVSLDEVKANFARLALLDERVTFLKGWFKDTLPTLRDQRWSVIRLDGDLYESTIQALTNLYPNLSPGGWLIVDDYGDIAVCKRAVDDYRQQNGITEPIQAIDHSGICWKRAQSEAQVV